MRLNLSKSLFIRGLQCHKSLYLDRYHPELKGTVSEAQQRIFDTGSDVGLLAQGLFPGGVEIVYEGFTPTEQIAMTAAEIRKGTVTIYEAAFEHDGVFMKADILHKGKGGWELYEVKATTEVKDVHVNDVALQYYVLTGAGVNVARAHLVHLNNQYVRNGAIEVDKLFLSKDITEAVRDRQTIVPSEIARMREILSVDIPAIDIGKYCDNPYSCDFHDHCWQHIPEESVFRLKQRGARPFELYNQGLLHLKDVPLEMVSGSQLMQLQAFLGKKEFINTEEVRSFLDTLWYPLYFLDFETFNPAVPPFDGMRPYQQVTFQYSLHYIEREGGELFHHEYLADPNIDPRTALANKLLEEIPENACIVAYNAAFEMGRLRELAAFLPKFSMAIQTRIDNIRDLMIPFKKNHIYHWQMMGSYSQKAVLPVLVPDLSYKGMEVANGGMAMDAYARMCSCNDPGEVENIRTALLEYCKLDTLGMVRILERLREMA
ncbi:MAG: DUF2779 domain-containing protein, partial [Syntrophus sp. (in: bacteria)]|nr:DUF2779 domain-containing protein [Syntrophus sp. (in: bacteria)]